VSLRLLVVALAGALAMLAWQRAKEHPVHRPVAAFMIAVAVADVLRMLLGKQVLAPARALHPAGPYAGLARVAFHLDEALFLVWPLGLAALGFTVFLRHTASEGAAVEAEQNAAAHTVRAVGAVYLVTVVTLAAGYPTIRGPLLANVFLVAELAAVAAAVAAGAVWWTRPRRPTLTEGSVIVFACLQLGAVLRWQPAVDWDWQRIMYLVAFAALIFLHSGELWTRRQNTV
jgi:hypothetical protein